MNTVHRRFPSVSDSLYDGFPPGCISETSARLWPFGRIAAHEQFGRIVTLHRRAFDAERAGNWRRADFYWTEFARRLQASPPSDECWAYGRQALFPAESEFSGEQFRHAFVREIIIECHAGFFHGHLVAGADLGGRPKLHLDSIAALLAGADASEEAEVADSLGRVALQEGLPAQGGLESVWNMLADAFPRQPQYVVAAAGELHQNALGRHSDASETERLRVISNAIERAKVLCSRAPQAVICYQLLGVLYHEQAILLANADEVPEAILAARQAEAFGGQDPVLTSTQQQLAAIAAAMRQAADRAEEHIRQTPGAFLNAAGLKLVKDAKTGSSLADNWSASPAAEKIRRNRDVAVQVVPPAIHAAQACVLHVPLNALDGEEDTRDWLANPSSRRVRIQIAAAAILLILTAGLAAREAWGSRERERAWSRATEAMKARNSPAVLDALGDFFAAPAPLQGGGARREQAAVLYGETMGRWVAENAGRLSPKDRQRLELYRRQIIDRGLDVQEVRQ